MLSQRSTRVGFVCPQSFWRLFEDFLYPRCPNLILLHEFPVDLSAWDAQCGVLSLPMLFGVRIDKIPTPVPYLLADPERARAWDTGLPA
jgi:hypothetical protein